MTEKVEIGHSVRVAIAAAHGAEFPGIGRLSQSGELLLYGIRGWVSSPVACAPTPDFEDRLSRSINFFIEEDLHSAVHTKREKNPPTITVELLEEASGVWFAERVTLGWKKKKVQVGYADLPTFLVTK